MNYDKKLESCKESIWSHSYMIGWIRRFMSHNEILHRSCIWNSRPNITSKSWQTLVNQILYLMMSKILRKYGPVKHFLRLLQICNILVWNTCEQCSFPFLKRTIPGEKLLKKKSLLQTSQTSIRINWRKIRNWSKDSHQGKMKILTSI